MAKGGYGLGGRADAGPRILIGFLAKVGAMAKGHMTEGGTL